MFENQNGIYATEDLSEDIGNCDSIEQLQEEVLSIIHSQKLEWASKIKQIIEENGFTKAEFAQLCGVSRVSVDKWCKGVLPKSRERFIRIGIAAGYGREDLDHLLKRYGGYSGLYAKSLEDCICIYVVNHYKGREAIEKYQFILERIKTRLVKDENEENTNQVTEKFDEKLSEVNEEDELTTFITENISEFSYAYHKFYAKVQMYIKTNYYGFTVNQMAKDQNWSSALKNVVYSINNNAWYPTRIKIISLGLHLSMTRDQLDSLLMLAHMEPLCAKNAVESVIIYILNDAELNNMLDTSEKDYNPNSLLKYAYDVFQSIPIPGCENFISELSEVDDE